MRNDCRTGRAGMIKQQRLFTSSKHNRLGFPSDPSYSQNEGQSSLPLSHSFQFQCSFHVLWRILAPLARVEIYKIKYIERSRN